MWQYRPVGGCGPDQGNLIAPFEIHPLEQRLIGGSFTADRIINFGKITTGVTVAVKAMEGEEGTDGAQCTAVVACSSSFFTLVSGSRGPNLHKSGSSAGSAVWVAIPTGAISPTLVKKLHQGGIDNIVITTLAMIDAAEDGTPTAVQMIRFKTCFILYVDMMSSIYLTIFAFSYVAVKIVQLCVAQHSEEGANATGTGKYVWEYDYSASKTPGSGS
jgi:hypothetical protein